MEATRGQPAAAVVERFLGLWRDLLDRSRLTAGCAVVAVTVAAADDDLLDHAGTIFRTWTERLTELCAAGGMNPEPARRLAVTVIAATEGAVALCRAERSPEPFEDVSATLLSLSTTQLAAQGAPSGSPAQPITEADLGDKDAGPHPEMPAGLAASTQEAADLARRTSEGVGSTQPPARESAPPC
jgi:hypothetical protein